MINHSPRTQPFVPVIVKHLFGLHLTLCTEWSVLETFENNIPGWMSLWYLLKSCSSVAVPPCYIRETKITISVTKSNLLSSQNPSSHSWVTCKHSEAKFLTLFWAMDGHFVAKGCYLKWVGPFAKNKSRLAPELPSLLLCVWWSKSFASTPQRSISIHLIT